MANDLVTVATFENATKAHIAKGELEASGIRVMLADEETVGMLWHVAVALGGVKVQVGRDDLIRACEIIRHIYEEDELPLTNEELEAQAMAMPREDADDVAVPNTESESTVATENAEEPELNYREQCARKLFFVVWLSMAFSPLFAYAFYLSLNVLFGSGTLSPRRRFEAFVGCILMLPALVAGILSCSSFGCMDLID